LFCDFSSKALSLHKPVEDLPLLPGLDANKSEKYPHPVDNYELRIALSTDSWKMPPGRGGIEWTWAGSASRQLVQA
jgi:hypothetical protein